MRNLEHFDPSEALENIKVNVLITDKTGTITEGRPSQENL
jgi:cation transport ATPase